MYFEIGISMSFDK